MNDDGWVSVEDRLPDPDDDREYLVWVAAMFGPPRAAVDLWMGEDGWLNYGDGAEEVTHWQPLPSPPSASPEEPQGETT